MNHQSCKMKIEWDIITMSPALSRFVLIVIFLLPSSQIQSSERSRNDISCEFTNVDSAYSFRGSFIIEADPGCLMDVLYDFEHLQKLIPHAHSIHKIEEGSNWYDARYLFKRLFYTNESVYRKTLKRDEMKIEFRLISSSQNISLLPAMVSSSGYYRIKKASAGYMIEYFQENTMRSSLLNRIYLKRAKKEAIRFMRNLKTYIRKVCR